MASVSDHKYHEREYPEFGSYLKATVIRNENDIVSIKEDISQQDTILILRVTELAQKNLEELREIVRKICEFAKENGCEVARLGDERILVTPSSIRVIKPYRNH